MSDDTNGLEILARPECVRLLATARLGRVGLSMAALPVVLPVNFALMDDGIIVRSGFGTKFDAALTGSVVAFEADQVDTAEGIGWSVLVQGRASVIVDPVELGRAGAIGLRPWAGGPKDRFVRITMDVISGRRLHPVRPRATTPDLRVRSTIGIEP